MEFFDKIVQLLQTFLLAIGAFLYLAFWSMVIVTLFVGLTGGISNIRKNVEQSQAINHGGVDVPQVPIPVFENDTLHYENPAVITVQ